MYLLLILLAQVLKMAHKFLQDQDPYCPFDFPFNPRSRDFLLQSDCPPYYFLKARLLEKNDGLKNTAEEESHHLSLNPPIPYSEGDLIRIQGITTQQKQRQICVIFLYCYSSIALVWLRKQLKMRQRKMLSPSKTYELWKVAQFNSISITDCLDLLGPSETKKHKDGDHVFEELTLERQK